MSPSPSKKLKKLRKLVEKISANDKSLKEVKISGEDIGDAVLGQISSALKNNTSVKGLYLSKCNISSAGVEAIANALSINAGVEELSLSFNDIGDSGMRQLAQTLRDNSTLTDIHLRCCDIGRAGALSLCSVLLTNYSVTDINLEENHNIPEDILHSIKRHLANNANPSKRTKKQQHSQAALRTPINKPASDKPSQVATPPRKAFASNAGVILNNDETTESNGENLDAEKTNHEETDNFEKIDIVKDIAISIPTQLDVLSDRLIVQTDQFLGRGRFSQVYAATYSSQNDEKINVAFKLMNLNTNELSLWDMHNIHDELHAIHSMYLHENLVSTLGVTVAVDDILANSGGLSNKPKTTNFTKIGILSERATIGSLLSYIKQEDNPIDSTIAHSILFDVSKGMLALHAHMPHPIVHQNLKSSNILLFRSDQTQCGIQAKISDFGLPYVLSHDCTPVPVIDKDVNAMKNSNSETSVRWRAPETFGKKGVYSEASDVWSYAMVMYELATREVPFVTYDESEVMYALCVDKNVPDIYVPNFSFTDEFSIQLLESCWSINPQNRPRFGAIMKSFSYLFEKNLGSFVSGGTNSVEERLSIMNSIDNTKETFNHNLLENREKYKAEWEKFYTEKEIIEELLEIAKFFAMMYSDTPLQPDHFPFFEDVLSVAEICQGQFHTVLQSLVEDSNGTYQTKQRKSRSLLEIEFRNTHCGEPRKVIDIVQGLGFFTSPTDFIHFIEKLTTSNTISIVKFVDHLNNPLPDGYRNSVIYVAFLGRSGPKLVCELSLHFTGLHNLKDSLHKSKNSLEDVQSWRLCTDLSF